LAADVNAIEAGYQGRCDMLKAMFGSSAEKPAPDLPVMTGGAFRAMFGRSS